METKTAKIISVQENQRQWEHQGTKYFDHWIKFEGSDNVWIYSSKSDKCEKFKINETATFDCDIKINGSHTNYKIKPKQEQGGNPFKKGESKDQGIITYLSCLSSAANYFANTKPSNWNDVMEAADEAFKKATEKSTLNK